MRPAVRLLLVGALAVAVGAAAAGTRTAGALTPAERAAIDPVSVSVRGAERAGVIVTVRFRGDFARLFGRGNLEDAVVALILRPKSSAGAPAGLITKGPGPVGTLIRHTRSARVAAIRDGRELTFVVTGPGFSQVGSVEVAAFAEPPRRARRVGAGQADPWQAIVAAAKTSDYYARATSLLAAVDCDDLWSVRERAQEEHERLAELAAEVRAASDADLLGRIEETQAILRIVGREIERQLVERCGKLPSTVLRGSFAWRPDGPNEIKLSGVFAGPPGALVNAITVSLPPGRRVTNYLPPSQLQVVKVAGESVTFSGGEVEPGERVEANVRTTSEPAADWALDVGWTCEVATPPCAGSTTAERSDSAPKPPPAGGSAAAPPPSDLKKAASAVAAVNGAMIGALLAGTVAFPPDAVITIPIMFLHGVAIGVSTRIAGDPPDPGFARISEPRRPPAHLLSPGRGLGVDQTNALNALTANQATLGATLAALLHAVERAQGASAKRSTGWQLRQQLAAASFARESAAALDHSARLRAQLRGALAGSRFRVTVPVASANAALAKGLPASVVGRLRRAGSSAADLDAVAQALPKTISGGVRFPDLLVDAGMARAERRFAAALRAYASLLDRQSVRS